MNNKFNPLSITEDEYNHLLSSGIGIKLFGSSFPANVNIYKSLIAKSEACFSLYRLVKHFMNYTSASPDDIVKALLDTTLDADVFEVHRDIKAGLITKQDITDMLNDLELEEE